MTQLESMVTTDEECVCRDADSPHASMTGALQRLLRIGLLVAGVVGCAPSSAGGGQDGGTGGTTATGTGGAAQGTGGATIGASGGTSGTGGSGGDIAIGGSGGKPAAGGSGGAAGISGAAGRSSSGGVIGSGSGGVIGSSSGGVIGSGGVSGSGGNAGTAGAGAFGGAGGSPPLSVCPNCKAIFDGTNLSGWIQVPASSWSVVNGVMHSLGSARGFIYTANTYGDFRLIFTSRLVADPANHLPCVLFWGNSPTKDALSAIQVQPPNGYMWDYRTTGPTANMSPDRFEKRLAHPSVVDTQWNQCEMLANRAAGTLRFACCQTVGTAPCKATEVVDFTDPTAGLVAPLAFQVHNAGMIEEFKDVYLESPVADLTALLTTH